MTFLFSFAHLKIHLWFIVPLLIFVIYQKPLPFALWSSAFAGMFIDLQGEDSWIGITSIAFCLTILITRKLRRYFFSDRIETLSIMTFIFSSLATAIRLMSVTLLHRKFPSPLTKELIFEDLLLVPALDAGLSFIVFVLPLIILEKRREKDYS